MVKKQNVKKQAINTKKERIVLWAIIFALIIIQAISSWYLIKLWDYESKDSMYRLPKLINESEERRYSYPVIDIPENRVYIPEARVYLPLNETTRNLQYDYRNAFDRVSLNLSTSPIVGSQLEKDSHSCDKVVMISQSKDLDNTSYRDGGEISPTKDNLRYITVHNKDTCSIYYNNVQESLAEAAKLITSY